LYLFRKDYRSAREESQEEKKKRFGGALFVVEGGKPQFLPPGRIRKKVSP